jgi:hypothetical protein
MQVLYVYIARARQDSMERHLITGAPSRATLHTSEKMLVRSRNLASATEDRFEACHCFDSKKLPLSFQLRTFDSW